MFCFKLPSLYMFFCLSDEKKGPVAAVPGRMEFEKIKVYTRDEYKGAQEPVAFVWRGRRFEVVEILDRWYEGRMDSTRLPLSYFKVKTGEGERYILRYHEFFRAWGIRIPREAARPDD